MFGKSKITTLKTYSEIILQHLHSHKLKDGIFDLLSLSRSHVVLCITLTTFSATTSLFLGYTGGILLLPSFILSVYTQLFPFTYGVEHTTAVVVS